MPQYSRNYALNKKKMEALLVYYSRTGITRKVALDIAGLLKCDAEEIFDTKNRSGPLGYLSAGKDACLSRPTTIKETKKDPSLYDIVIVGTPVWAFTMSTPIRTYISQNKGKFKNIAFFCTQGGSGAKRAFGHMQRLCNKSPIATLELTTSEVINNKFDEKIQKWLKEVYER